MAMAITAGIARSAWATEPVPALLDAEKAFSVTARMVDERTLELRYAIAAGYYLYRDRFHFSINGQSVSVSPRAWPAGKWKQDANFGNVITYRDSVRLLLSISMAKLEATRPGRNSLALIASSQGCADAGICYPPLHQTLILDPGSSAVVSPQDQVSPGFSHHGLPAREPSDRLKSLAKSEPDLSFNSLFPLR
jgi:thiol:disulfide interchange protein DsbD